MKRTPPPLKGLPLVGNLFGFARDRQRLLTRAYERLGPIFSIRLGPKPVAVLIGPEHHQLFFTQTDKALSIDKPYQNLAALFGKVAFLAPPEVYQEQRPVLHSPFRPEKMRKYLGIMQREVQKWIDALGEAGEVEISGEMSKLVQVVAGHALMGEDFQNRLGREFWDLYAVLGKALNFTIPPHWPLPRNIRRDRAKRRMRELLRPIIAERRQHPERYDDFLQDFVLAHCRSGAVPDDETIISLIRALMFASHETTAGQAAWTIIELLRHPEYVRLLRSELEQTLPTNAVIDGELLRRLRYIYWAVREIERLHPSADMMLRWANHDIDVDGYVIPAGWLVMVTPAVAHRSRALFADPDRFDPLRFAPGREEDQQHSFALIGFGGGRHKCTGMNFANSEMMIIAALLFQQLRLELLTPNPKAHFGLGAARPTATHVRYRRVAHETA